MTDDELDHILTAVRRRLKRLRGGEIVSAELGLLKVGGEAAFEATCMVRGNRQIQVRSDFYTDGRIETVISLHRCPDDKSIFFISRDGIQPYLTLPEAIEVCQRIRDRIDEGASYEQAIEDEK